MANWISILIDLSIIALLVIGIAQFRTPHGARRGNATAATALLMAIALVLYRHGILDPVLLALALLVGSAIGALIAMRVTMIQIPAMVAFQHGAGGVAASAIAFVELTRAGDQAGVVGEVSGFLGLIIGAATFSGSMLASAKLAAKIRQTPTVLPGHNLILLVLLGSIAGLCLFGASISGLPLALALGGALLAAVLLGLVFAVRIGGADMPVLISFLNATAGLAAAFCGVAIQNQLLIACGATVAASGTILTAVMCKAMNRSFVRVLAGGKLAPRPVTEKEEGGGGAREAAPPVPTRIARTPAEAVREAKAVLREAKSVIIIPGYGMALARAQFQVASLAKLLEQQGKAVSFGVHPVAGRMPGHMNVLLAEADVDYEKLREMDEVNKEFAATDAVLIIGACDVVNPAAIRVANTPISGMPIMNAHEARHVIVCNLDERPGYSGVKNPLYDEPKTLLLFGDANATVTELLEGISAQAAGVPSGAAERPGLAGDAAALLATSALSERLLKAEYAVRGPIVQRAQELEAKGEEIIYCNIGNPQALGQRPMTYMRQLLCLLEYPALLDEPAIVSRFPGDVVARARLVLAKHPHGTGAYTQSPGIPFIRQAVAEFISRRDGIPADPGKVILTDGASKGVQAVLTALLRSPQDGFMIPIPQYPLYSASLTLLGGQRIGYLLDEDNHWQLSEQSLTDSLSRAEQAGIHAVGLVVINPGNPTGAVLSRENIEMIIGVAHRHRLALIADEVYQENVYDDRCAFHSFAKVLHELGDTQTPLFSLHSVSKGFLGECGHRGGYLELRNVPAPVLQEFIKLQSIALCANVPGQLATYVMVAPPKPGEESHAGYVRERGAILEELKQKAALLGEGINRIPGMSVHLPQGAMYAFVRFELPQDPFIDLAAMSAEERAAYAARQEAQYCLNLLEETGICVVPGSGFGQQPGTLHFRATFLPQRREIQALVARLGEFHRRYTQRNQSSAA